MPLRISDLADLDADDSRLFGGKAAGLGRLIHSGAAVPEGFAVEAVLSERWEAEPKDDFLRRAVTLARDGRVAVRSSAVGEDSRERSFAGLFESILDVGSEDVLAAAARCIASGASERVLSYAGARGAVPVGLAVQRMVSARAAGVCFTRDPTGADSAVVVEAVLGTGDRLVSGAEEPERYRAYRSGLGTWEVRAGRGVRVLTVEQCKGVALSASALEDAFGHPLDLEWAIDTEGRLWWLQARPITAAAKPPTWVIERSRESVDDGPVSVWSNWNVRETLPEPLHHLTWTTWRDVIVPMVMRQLYGVPYDSPLMPHLCGLDLVHGRLYFNLNAAMAAPLFGPLMMRGLGVVDARAGATVRRLMDSGVLTPRRLPGSGIVLAARVAAASLWTILRLLRGLGPRRCRRILEEDSAAISRRPPVADLSDRQLCDEMTLWIRPECRRLRDGLQMESVAMVVYSAATALFRRHTRALELLTAGIPDNPTTEISLGIEALVASGRPFARVIQQSRSVDDLKRLLDSSPEGASWLQDLSRFLDRFGHRAPMEFDLGATRWREDPTMILDLVRAGLQAPSGRETVSARLSRLRDERRGAIEDAVRASAWWRRPLMRWSASLVERYMPLREAPKHHGVVVFARIRDAARELGRRLVARSILAAADEAFFLDWRELQALARGEAPPADLASRIEERRQRHERFKRERAPDFLRSDGVPVEEVIEDAPEEPGVLRGTPVSAGTASGPARILRAPDPSAMQDGDVIVVEFADPCWTPLFPRASAVVMEVGGLMCHAAVVVREMGIPAVFGAKDATRRLHDGERVMVDGRAGTVRSSSKAPPSGS